MGTFISVEVSRGRCAVGEGCAGCVEKCPVNIFAESSGEMTVVGEREDECLLCRLCTDACPRGAIRIHKLY